MYSLYERPVAWQAKDDGLKLRVSIKCSKPGCKRTIVRKEHTGSSDKSSTGEMGKHARRCWGDARVAEVKAGGSREAADAEIKSGGQRLISVYYEDAISKKRLTIPVRNQTYEQLRFVHRMWRGPRL